MEKKAARLTPDSLRTEKVLIPARGRDEGTMPESLPYWAAFHSSKAFCTAAATCSGVLDPIPISWRPEFRGS